MNRRRAVVGLMAFGSADAAWPGSSAYPASTERRLRFTLTFTNPGDLDLHDQAFWFYLPATIDGGQRLLRTESTIAHRIEVDALGHRILHLEFAVLPAFAHKVVTVTTVVGVDESRLSTPIDRDAWLGPERYIESTDAAVVELASTLRRESQLQTARAIYDWVRTRLVYAGYVAADLGALYALTNRSGDCTEYADLVVALARANGIPARMIGGFVVAKDAAPRPEDYHNWAEVFLADAWRVVDAQKESWLDGARYIAFRIYRDVAGSAIESANRYRVQGRMTVSFDAAPR